MRRRMLNDKMMYLERVFLLPSGLPGRPTYKHALFSPAKFNSYGKGSLQKKKTPLYWIRAKVAGGGVCQYPNSK